MPSISNILTNLYLLVTFSLFSYTAFIKYNQTQNYFAAALQMMDSPLTKLLLYNIVIAIAVITYKVTIFLFYEEVKENETLNLIQKIGYKLFQLCFFLYAAGREFGLQTFVSMTIVFMMFIFHNIAISRASFLIHAHVSENMNLNFRLLAHFIILLFIDYEITIHTFSWLFTEGQNPSLILFAYYCITMSLTIIEPALNFFMHFYQSYTNCMIENLDINMMKLKFVINIPLLAFQLILSIILSFQLSLSFVLIFTIIQTINQIVKTFKSYKNMKGLIDKMKNLRQLGPQQLEKQHDRVCTVCFAQATTSALILPCKHIFHKQCLRQWIIKNSNHHCPKCKKTFDFENMKDNTKLDEQIKKGRQYIKQMNAENQRIDPLGFARDQVLKQYNGTKREITQKRHQHHGSSFQQDQREILKIDDNNHVSKISNTRVRKTRQPMHNIGSVPFGLPTQAVYSRKQRDMKQRERIIQINDKMIKFMKMDPAKQLLFVPEF